MEQYIATLAGEDYLFCSENCLGQWISELTLDEQGDVATGEPTYPWSGPCERCSALTGG